MKIENKKAYLLPNFISFPCTIVIGLRRFMIMLNLIKIEFHSYRLWGRFDKVLRKVDNTFERVCLPDDNSSYVYID